MRASTRSISLVLLGSALFLGACQQKNEDEDPNNPQPQSRGGCHGGGGFIYGLGGRPGGRVGVASPSAGGSTRGGFGGTSGGVSASS